MSASPWWKKELMARRRPRGTVVVAKPLIPPALVERAAEIFERPPEPAPPVAVPAFRPTGPAEAPTQPPVWPRAFAVLPPPVAGPVVPPALELVPEPEPDPEPEPEPELPPAAELPAFVFPELALEEAGEPVQVTPPPVLPLFASSVSESEPEPERQPEPEPEPEPAAGAGAGSPRRWPSRGPGPSRRSRC